MWKHLLWVCINTMPVIQGTYGIPPELWGRGICPLAIPFPVTVWAFFCPTQTASPAWVGGCKQAEAGVLPALPVASQQTIPGIWQLAWAQVCRGQAESRQLPGSSLFFACMPVYLFWGEGKKLNKNSYTAGVQAVWCFLLWQLTARNFSSETWFLNNLEVYEPVVITERFLECTLKCYQLNCVISAWMPLHWCLGLSGLLSRTSYLTSFPTTEMCLHSERAEIDADRTLVPEPPVLEKAQYLKSENI